MFALFQAEIGEMALSWEESLLSGLMAWYDTHESRETDLLARVQGHNVARRISLFTHESTEDVKM